MFQINGDYRVILSYSIYAWPGLLFQIIIKTKNSIHFDYATLSIRLEMINVDPDNVSLHNRTRLYK